MMAAGNVRGASDIVFYGGAGLGRDSKQRTHRQRARVGGDVSAWQEKASCRQRWSVSTGKRTRLDIWFSQAHDLIAFPRSDGSAILYTAGRWAALANGPGYDVRAWTRQHTTSWTA